MTEAEKAYQYFVIAVPENEEQAKAYFWARKALQSTLTQPPITGDTSDGYHTFNELYHHRAILFSVICNERPDVAWKSKRHHDGTMYDGMFIVGIDTPEGQATYHYDIEPYWNLFRVKELELAPEWDGHTPGEAIRRIGTLTPPNELVSVEDRLPEYNPGTGAKSYWVAKKDNAGNWQMKIAQYCDYGYAMTMDAETEVTWRDWDFTKIANVTHWMLLPAPPDRRPPEGKEARQ